MAEATPTRSRKLSEKTFVEEFLTCRLCEEQFNDDDRVAKVLTCMHTFCKTCLQKLVQDQHVRCPYCKRKWALPDSGFPNHYMLEDLKEYRSIIKETDEDDDVLKTEVEVKKCSCCPTSEEAGAAVAYCTDCRGNVCQTCIDNHQLMRPMKNHNIQKMSSLHRKLSLRKSACRLHSNQDLTVYCTTCNKPVCHTCCALTEHEGHQRIDLNLALIEIKSDLRVLAARGREKQEPLEGLLTSIDAVINDLNMICIGREEEIQSMFDELEKVFKVQCENAKEILRQLCQDKTQRLQKQKSEVESLHTEYESACEFAEQACQIANPIQLLSSQTQISRRLNDLNNANNHIPELTEPLENTYIAFQDAHTTALQDFRRTISDIGIVRSSTTLPSLCRLVSLPAQFHAAGDLTLGETEFALVRSASVGDEQQGQATAGGDPFTAQLISPDGSRKECKVTDHMDGSYDIAYTPTTFGSHKLDICLFDRPIKGSPFDINVESSYETYLPTFDGVSWLPAVAGFPHVITVTLPEDSDCAKALVVQTEIQTATGQMLPCTVNKQKNISNVYTIQYTPTMPDQLCLTVKANGQDLPNSPYAIEVTDLSKEKTEISFGTPVVNQRWMISVLPKDHQGRAVAISHAILQLNVTTLKQAKDLKIVAHHVTSDFVHVFHCLPSKVGIHQVDVFIHGVSVLGRAQPVNVDMWINLPTIGDKESCPTSLATSPSGVIFLSDTKVGSIRVQNTAGSYSNIAVNMRKSSQIAIDHQGRILLLVPERRRVHVYKQGESLSEWKCTRDNSKPVSIACSRHAGEDMVIIGDASTDFNGLFLYKSDGIPIKCIPLSSNFLIEGRDCICTNDKHHIFVCHSTRAKVVEFSFEGIFIREFSTDAKGNQLAIASTPDGFLLVAERERIIILDLRSGFAKPKGDIKAYGDSYSSMAATNDGCVIALDVSQKRLVRYGYLIN